MATIPPICRISQSSRDGQTLYTVWVNAREVLQTTDETEAGRLREQLEVYGDRLARHFAEGFLSGKPPGRS